MRKLLGVIGLVISSIFFGNAHASKLDFSECRVAETTKMRMMNDIISKGDIAVTRNGDNIILKDILADKMIHFKSTDGQISESYQWMYNKIFKVENRNTKYLSSSYGEDVIITLGAVSDKPEQLTVSYTGTKSRNYLTLLCE